MSLAPILAQTGGFCDAGTSGIAYLLDWKFIQAFTCSYANTVGLLVLGMMVYGGVSLSIYIRTGSVVIPSVLLLLTGGVVLSQVAAPVVGIATVMLLTVGGGLVAYVYYVYSR